MDTVMDRIAAEPEFAAAIAADELDAMRKELAELTDRMAWIKRQANFYKDGGLYELREDNLRRLVSEIFAKMVD
jgi:hypothetical protein